MSVGLKEEEGLRSAESERQSQQQGNGVDQVEAITSHWSKTMLVVSYMSIFLAFYVYSLQLQTTGPLKNYMVSNFNSHSLLDTVNIVVGIFTAVCKPLIAKVCDVFGRLTGLVVMVVVYSLGFVMMATSQNISMFAAANVFTSIGSTGLFFILQIMISDTSSLSSRPLLFAINQIPFLVNVFVGSAIGEAFINSNAVRTGYGIWAIIIPTTCLPLVYLISRMGRQLKRKGLWPEPQWRRMSSRKAMVNILQEMDLVGIALLAAGAAMLLLPLVLANKNTNNTGWQKPENISLFILGGLTCIAWVVWDIKFAKFPLVPIRLLKDRSVAAALYHRACSIHFILYME